MKSTVVMSLAIWLSLIVTTSSRTAAHLGQFPLQHVEEREIITRESLDAYLKAKDSMAGPIMDLTKAGLGGLNTLSRINYTQSAGQVAWEVAEAVVPIIGAALALIPGVGVVVSGLFLGLWSLISPIFAPKKDNPMEKMIKELAEKMNKQMDEKLTSLINRTIYGEITRNNYVCSKYNFISQDFTKDLKAGNVLKDIDALKLMIYLDNCDNFLKDTAEAFVFYEYANVLWIPGAITTMVRLGFLTELFRYGHSLGMKPNMTAMYLQELKKDIHRQFVFMNQGIQVSHKLGTSNYNKDTNYLKDVTEIEKSACVMQGQFFYFNPELYPYGMPKVFNNTDILANISMDKSANEKIKHIQIFFNISNPKFGDNLPENKHGYRLLEFMNCFMGPTFVKAPNSYWFNFHTVPGKVTYSYEFRVMYLQHERKDYQHSVPVLTELNKKSQQYIHYLNMYKKLYPKEDQYQARSQTMLTIDFLFPTDIDSKEKVKNSKKLIDVPGWARWKTCPHYNVGRLFVFCNTGVQWYMGHFRMYSAGTFNHNDEIVNPIISIAEPLQRYNDDDQHPEPAGYLLGIEIILRPHID